MSACDLGSTLRPLRRRNVFFGTTLLGLALGLWGTMQPTSLLHAQNTAAPSVAVAPAAGGSPALRVQGPLSPRNASYRLSASLDPATHTVKGKGTLVWRNLERQPVDHMVLHLYQNGFKNFASTYVREAGAQLRGTKMPKGGFGAIDVTALRSGSHDLLASSTVVDSLMAVQLPNPVGPSATIELTFEWTVRLPHAFARSGWAQDFHAVSQWFPKVGVWDCGTSGSDCKWRAHQYHGFTEFFADYGVYDVEMSVPTGQVLGATGVKVGERVEGDRTIYRYLAEDVHDFAWFTDPKFVEVKDRIDDEFGGVEVRLLTRAGDQDNTPRNLAGLRAGLLEAERRFGVYPYRNVTVVIPPRDGSGAGGMEYPTIITGIGAPLPSGLHFSENTVAHEFGHQYFYHLLGSDEVEEAWLDEGLNQTFTSWAMERLYPTGCTFARLPYLCLADADTDWLAYRSVARRAALSTPSYKLPRGSYGAVTYNQTAITLRTLERYLGPDRMITAMRRYTDRNRFRHPRKADFVAAMSDGAGEDLSWYFDQTLNTTRVADFEISSATTDEHEPAAGLWDCPPQPLPRSKLLPRTESGPQLEELDALWTESAAAACENKQPGRTELQTSATDESRKKSKSSAKDSKGKAGDSDETFDSEVVVRRRGELLFPVTIKATFADGSTVLKNWTLAEQQAEPENRYKVLRFLRRPARLERAEVDPGHQLLLDEKRLNNGLLVSADPRPVRRLWLSWEGALQTLLDWVAF
jgi:hypothetical protein